MKNLLFGLIFLAVVASGYGVYRNFDQFHRGRNSQAPRPELIIYTHSSFMSPFGPGADIAAQFSKICLCEVKYIDGGGGKILLRKIKLAKNVDVVLGLDQASLKDAARSIKWRSLKPYENDWKDIFINNTYKTFLAYDWAPVSFIFKEQSPLKNADSLEELLRQMPDRSLSLPDARQSSLGLQLVYWAYLEAQQDLDKLDKLAKLVKQKTKKVSADWSGSYGFFKRGMSPFVLSYSTSPLYHLKEENDSSYNSVLVKNGHPIHLEYAAVPDKCRSCSLAKRFVEFLASPSSQRTLYEKNYMLPVINSVLTDKEQALVPKVQTIDTKYLDAFIDQKDKILGVWNLGAN